MSSAVFRQALESTGRRREIGRIGISSSRRTPRELKLRTTTSRITISDGLLASLEAFVGTSGGMDEGDVLLTAPEVGRRSNYGRGVALLREAVEDLLLLVDEDLLKPQNSNFSTEIHNPPACTVEGVRNNDDVDGADVDDDWATESVSVEDAGPSESPSTMTTVTVLPLPHSSPFNFSRAVSLSDEVACIGLRNSSPSPRRRFRQRRSRSSSMQARRPLWLRSCWLLSFVAISFLPRKTRPSSSQYICARRSKTRTLSVKPANLRQLRRLRLLPSELLRRWKIQWTLLVDNDKCCGRAGKHQNSLELTDVKNSYFKDGKIFFKDATWTASSKKWSGPSRDYEEGVTFDIATGRKYRNGAISVVKGVEVHREDCSMSFGLFLKRQRLATTWTTCRFAVSSDTRDVILFPDKSIERQSCLQSDDRGLLFFEVLGGKCIHHYECSNYILFVKDGDHEWAMQKFRKSHRGEPSNSPCQLDAVRQSQAKFGYVNESKAVVLVKEASKPGIKCHIADLPEPGKSMTLPEGNEIPMGWPTGDLFRSGENFFFWTSGSYWNLKIVNGICKVDIKKPPQLTKILIDKQQEIFNGFTQKGDSASIIGPSAFLWRGEKNVTLVHSLKTNSKSFAQFSSLAAF
ncbi:hypothetical protein L596_017344 [Steinernema carpocapsae]|uniref:Uncharacterized protein n=1 Tax=Steinernema carpocapsae TaxID=34508 RepID=A0A4U5N1C8_STECR|nr:hypothetical protein L596_017344 [Steinernema carpocapsae]